MRLVLIVLFALGISVPAGAADLTAIPRVILKEPVYEGKPRYCLLVLGQKADTRIWVVYDGKNFYLDHKGNGDLTEPGVRMGATGSTSLSSKITERDGTTHRNFWVNTRNDGTFDMMLGQEGHRMQFVGIGKMGRPTWGDRAEDAPIIHFNGPMSFETYGPIHTIARVGQAYGRRLSLRVMLGTPGLGKGTFASYDEICSEKLGKIQADIVYLSAQPFGVITRQRIELIHDG